MVLREGRETDEESRPFTIIRGDSRDKDLIKSLVKESDAIIPLACLTGAPLCDRDQVGAKSINFDAVKYLTDIKSKDQMLIYPKEIF